MLLMELEKPKQSKRIQSKFYPHQSQLLIRNSPSRFNLVFAGRRFGKSVLAVNQCIDKALTKQNQRIWYCSPLYKQTKEIAWNLFDFYCPKEWIAKKNETELKIILINGSEISLKGTDTPDSLVGVGLNFCVLDEFPLMESDVWYKIVRPMMIDTKGECLFIGTPRGYNWAYELYRNTQKDNDLDFSYFFFKTVDNTAIDGMDKEVAKAQREATSELDKIVFRQEYEATFEVVTGRPRFDIELINKLKSSEATLIDKIGLLDVYHKYDPLAIYVVGVDTSEGLETGDNSSVIFLNCKSFQVDAEYNGKLAPDILASHIKSWCNVFGDPLVVVEDNNHGLVTLTELRNIYFNIYYRKQFDEMSQKWTKKIGFRTTQRTKHFLIDNLDKALRGGLHPSSGQIIDELMTYVIGEDGDTNASEGKHDDRVIGLGLAYQGFVESEHYKDAPKEKPKLRSLAYYEAQSTWEKQEAERARGNRVW